MPESLHTMYVKLKATSTELFTTAKNMRSTLRLQPKRASLLQKSAAKPRQVTISTSRTTTSLHLQAFSSAEQRLSAVVKEAKGQQSGVTYDETEVSGGEGMIMKDCIAEAEFVNDNNSEKYSPNAGEGNGFLIWSMLFGAGVLGLIGILAANKKKKKAE